MLFELNSAAQNSRTSRPETGAPTIRSTDAGAAMSTVDTHPAATPASPTRTDAAWLDAHWMPFTANREFKANPRMIVEANGAYFTDSEGRKIFDGLSGLWCSGLGHGRREISDAVAKAVAKLDYSPGFQFGHPASFALANKIRELTPAGLDYVFFVDSGSEAADTSLKMARAYWRTKGQAGKTRLIGREKGYHGVNYGGISVGGIAGNRKLFGQGVEADHIPHTQPPAGSFHRGMPADGGRALADRLLDVIALHDASTIAAVIVEPFSGCHGVLAQSGSGVTITNGKAYNVYHAIAVRSGNQYVANNLGYNSTDMIAKSDPASGSVNGGTWIGNRCDGPSAGTGC